MHSEDKDENRRFSKNILINIYIKKSYIKYPPKSQLKQLSYTFFSEISKHWEK